MNTAHDERTPQAVDVCVIGGGINGAGVARDAVGRGYSVLLVEMGDIASATSSWSTKLIHGGLRYLEHNEFALVRDSLIERARLLSVASHLVTPLRFVLPHGSGMRPAWLIRLGLFLYDNLSMSRKVPGSKGIKLSTDPAGEVLKPALRTRGFTYYDCQVDDVRLTLANLSDAAKRGATIQPGTKLVEATASDGIWKLTLERQSDGVRYHIHARHVVNTAGPWADKVAHLLTGSNSPIGLRLVRGSHIVVRKPAGLNDAYLFQQPDERVVFAIPYQNDYALIGTTDADHTDPSDVHISDEETDYLLKAANLYLDRPVTRDDIAWTFAGVRPLLDDGTDNAQEVTRDYKILTSKHLKAGLTNVFGGKLTTFRTLSQKVVDDLAELTKPSGSGMESGWTGYTAFDDAFVDDVARGKVLEQVQTQLSQALSVVDAGAHAERLVQMYGRSAQSIAGIIAGGNEQALMCGLFPSEIEHMVEEEWARTADDVLFRRSKLGIDQPKSAFDEVQAILDNLLAKRAAA
ncbi:glycerol-3-phosphate dehydrogenase [Ahrensia marina]|uniref:glycerol-3-phosphate dehydrogenase n=1 Tax=Ahrensia marina TaxID=1514904 RepID=UPI0035CFDE33